MLGAVGVTVIVDRFAAVTVSVVLPETPPKVAVIVVVPAATEVAKPCEPPALLIVATPAVDELQATCVVRSCVVKTLYMLVAVNCLAVQFVILVVAGVTVIIHS